jgi:hypothetical protein
MADDAKNRIIKKAYDEAKGSIRETLEAVKSQNGPDTGIKYNDVKAWHTENLNTLKLQKGFNSYVAPGPKHEFQIDLFWYKFKQPDAEKVKKRQHNGTEGEGKSERSQKKQGCCTLRSHGDR